MTGGRKARRVRSCFADPPSGSFPEGPGRSADVAVAAWAPLVEQGGMRTRGTMSACRNGPWRGARSHPPSSRLGRAVGCSRCCFFSIWLYVPSPSSLHPVPHPAERCRALPYSSSGIYSPKSLLGLMYAPNLHSDGFFCPLGCIIVGEGVRAHTFFYTDKRVSPNLAFSGGLLGAGSGTQAQQPWA